MKTLSFPPYYPKTDELDKCNHVTLFLNAVFISCDHLANVILVETKALQLRNMVWKASSMTPVLH